MVKMKCDTARKALSQGNPPAEAEEHLSTCPLCEQWLDAELERAQLTGTPSPTSHASADIALDDDNLSGPVPNGAGSDDVPSTQGLAQLDALLSKEDQPVGRLRSLPTALRWRLLLLAALVVATLQLLFFYRADLGVYPKPRLIVEAVLHVLLVLGLVAVFLRPLFRSAWPTAPTAMLVIGAVLLPMAVALTNPAHAMHGASLEGAGADYWQRAIACLLWGTTFGLPVVVLGALLDRQPGIRWSRIFVLAALGTGVGALALLLHCPIVHPSHLWVGHTLVAAPLLAIAVLTAYVVYRRTT